MDEDSDKNSGKRSAARKNDTPKRASAGADRPQAGSSEGHAGQSSGNEAGTVSVPSPAEAEAALEALTVAHVGDDAKTPTLADALPPVSPDHPETPLSIDQLKEKIMADTPNSTDFNKAADQASNTASQTMTDMQNRSRAALEKSSEVMTEASDFAKGNVEAMVESSKIIATGLQELGRTYSEEARTAYEQMSADMREMAAIKSPTELFQLQSKIMRRNFDSLVSASSKNTESMMKLATDAFQPLSGRINVAADKASKIS